MSTSATNAGLVELTIDGKLVQVPAGTTVFDAARVHGIAIPTLCHLQNQTPVGVCRLCVVDTGGRVLSAACVRPVEPGMKVSTNSEKVQAARRTLLELLMADHPSPCARQEHSGDCELETLAKAAGAGTPRFPRRTVSRGADDSSPAIAVDHDACILCDRCIRGCDEIKNNFVLGRMGKGYSAGIAFDLNSPMGDSTCISCGECMVSCPTGALTNKGVVGTAIAAGRDAQSLTAEELHRLPVFAGVSGTFLELNRGAIVKRRYRKGEVICREGEFGSTAFYILEGKAQVAIATPIAHVKTQGGTIQLNHAIHLKPIRRGPNGPIVQLECDDCHRPAGVNQGWPYSDKVYVVAASSYSADLSEVLPNDTLWTPKPLAGRENMIPPKFAATCAACHLLTFDKRFDVGVPHDKPEVVHVFLIRKFREYIAAHPAEVRIVPEPTRDLTGKPRQAEVRVLTPAQWVAERTADAEELLWRKTCKQCHLYEAPVNSAVVRIPAGTESEPETVGSLPDIAPAKITIRWLPHAKFNHDAHRSFTCTSCHAKALSSTETSDVLIPGIENCKACHAPGPEHAESRCFECHTYHDWSKWKEVKPAFTLPALQNGGR